MYFTVTQVSQIMHRTQVTLEDHQYQRLQQEAKRLGMSLSHLLSQLVNNYFNHSPEPDHPLDKLAGIAQGTGEPVGREHNRYLYGDSNR